MLHWFLWWYGPCQWSLFPVWGFKHDVLCIVRSEALRGHKDQSVTYPSGPWCLQSHSAQYIMLKSNDDVNYLVLIYYEAEICKLSSKAGYDNPCIVENPCMVLWVTCIAMSLWRHKDPGVTKSTQNINANMCTWESSFCKSCIDSFKSVINQIQILAQFCKK